jgi:hypothetical protein
MRFGAGVPPVPGSQAAGDASGSGTLYHAAPTLDGSPKPQSGKE